MDETDARTEEEIATHLRKATELLEQADMLLDRANRLLVGRLLSLARPVDAVH